ncbi:MULTISPECIES: protocatechuate 3,4-dioxygenase [Marinobacterium]|uniref:Protocatechuate 4,5-dioxygenase, beta chain n=2 Tax=Marinobacterium TaxID=48075 RepID=A0A1H6BZ96_9GAMM|nr:MULTISPECIES: protocatechuate 3,4-dioxygenase [Marinobacterium]TCK04284.1 protocatechuate 4,5-dioxygenase beta chain [Marinobacterium mangrovicola]SEG66018.1 protocatechuate 4,5-dioxygenase, beta chain [Marinobacterium lutimaris]
MAQIVGGFLVPHDPVMFVAGDAAPADKAEKVWGAFETCAQRLADSGATTVIIVGNDHYMLFGTTCLPKYCIATGHLEGPLDQLPGLKRGQIENNEALATAIAEHGAENGFDWSVARSFTTDHSFSIPHQLIVRRAEELSGRSIAAIPVYLASAVDPYITTERSRELGAQMNAAIEAFAGDDKVAVIGSGGISHWVGTKESGKVNEAFDRRVIDSCCSLDMDGLASLSNEEILEEGGNGAMEIRNFLCAMAAVNPVSTDLVEYQPVPEWVTGLGFIELKVA